MQEIFKLDLKRVENYLVTGLRFSIAIVFIWFGALKVLGFNPVEHIIAGTFPMFATEIGTIVLGIMEVVIGLGLVMDIFPIVVHGTLILHLLGTMMTFLVAPSIMFQPYFPVLSLEGEFVVKNIVLALAGMVVLVHERRNKIKAV